MQERERVRERETERVKTGKMCENVPDFIRVSYEGSNSLVWEHHKETARESGTCTRATGKDTT